MNIPSLFHPLSDYQLFSDTHFWEVPTSDEPAEDVEAAGRASEGDFHGIELKKKSRVDPEVSEGLM